MTPLYPEPHDEQGRRPADDAVVEMKGLPGMTVPFEKLLQGEEGVEPFSLVFIDQLLFLIVYS